MAQFEKTLYGRDLWDTANVLNQRILDSAYSMELAGETNWQGDGVTVLTRVYEKYFMRASNRATITITMVQTGETLYISGISAGGGQGAIFRFSWGAEEDFASDVEALVDEL